MFKRRLRKEKEQLQEELQQLKNEYKENNEKLIKYMKENNL